MNLFPPTLRCTAQLRASLLLGAMVCASASHGGTTKDVVLERVSLAQSAEPVSHDAMAVSVLQELPDGTLRARGVDARMRTGDRLRIKVMASRAGKLSIYNTPPGAQMKADPIWSGTVQPGQETVTPRMVITNQSGAGVEYLHVMLEPSQAPAGVWVWIGQWLNSVGQGVKSAQTKDVVLDVENTATATYLVNAHGQGLMTTVSIAHR